MTLDQYLRRATRGLWGKRRLEAIAELRGSLEARAWALECQGFSPEKALETALREMGEAGAIAAGLRGVHTMPNILKNTLALVMIAGLSITALNSSRAEVEVVAQPFFQLQNLGNVKLLNGNQSELDTYYLNLQSIQQNLEQLGINVDATPQTPLAVWKLPSQAPIPALRFTMPGAARAINLQAPWPAWKTPAGQLETSQPAPSDTPISNRYVSLLMFVHQLYTQSDLPVRVLGWRNPRITVGSTVLQIGSETAPATAREVFRFFAANIMASKFKTPCSCEMIASPGTHRFALRVQAPAGTVFAIATTDDYRASNRLAFDVARVSNDGILEFTSLWRVLAFSKSFQAIVGDQNRPLGEALGTPTHPAAAVLVQINPDFSSEVVMPGKNRIAALK